MAEMRSQPNIEYVVGMMNYPSDFRYPPDFVRDLDRAFGDNVRERRLHLGLNQAHVVAMLGAFYRIDWNQTVLSKVELGTRMAKTPEAFALAEILGMTLEDLAFGRGLDENFGGLYLVYPDPHGKHPANPE